MNQLKEIPENVKMFTTSEIALMSIGVMIVVILLLTWLLCIAFKTDRAKAFKDFEGLDRDNLPENFDHSKLPENIFKSRSALSAVTEQSMAFILMIGLMTFAATFGILAILTAFSSNRSEVEAVASYNISEVYKVSSDDLKFVYEFTGDSTIKEVNAKYTDLESAEHYDLTFTFKDNKEPILLKTGNVTDELINDLKK